MIRTKILQQFLLVVLVCIVQGSARRSTSRLLEAISSCPVYLTISSKGKSLEDSPIIINWGPACKNPPKWIGLFDKDPSTNSDEAKTYVVTNSTQKGVHETNVTVGQLKLPDGWNRNDFLSEPPKRVTGGQCLSFYVASFDETSLKSLDCLKIQPTWMNDINHLKEVPLKNLFIPGRLNITATIKKRFENILIYLSISRKVLTVRDVTIKNRMDQMFCYNDEVDQPVKFWAVNENLFITPISVIIGDIRRFISLANQIVIIDFNAFPIGFNRDRHIQFLKYLESEFKHIAFPNDNISHSYDLTISEMEARGRLLIIYNQPDMEKETNIIWPSWKRFSTKDLRTTEMKEYMRKVFSMKYNGSASDHIGWSFFGRQGVESSYISGSSLLTTRERAYRINHDLSVWLGGIWSLSANVVALDYFYSTNLIDMAIHINRHKASQISDLVFFDMDVK
ncbi:hypothetical protein HA402_014866 [Bradysia odoriphaga]|nr:hypothetical protein HA402_014866 [Bradysia odoriphaga]